MSKKVTAEEKLLQIEEARECYEQAYKLIQKGNGLIMKYMRDVKICDSLSYEPIHYEPYKGMIEVHLYSGMSKFEKLFKEKAKANVNLCGDKDRDRKALCIGGIKFMQIGRPTESRFCYR